MRAAEALIAWNGADDGGAVAIGPLLRDGEPDWARAYTCTGGAAHIERRSMSGCEQRLHVKRDWYLLVYVYGIDPYVAHRAFLLIDEYQAIIKEMGCGPARDEPGHDSDVGYGRAVVLPTPSLQIRQSGRATHLCTAEA
jgi:hypothetical protein